MSKEIVIASGIIPLHPLKYRLCGGAFGKIAHKLTWQRKSMYPYFLGKWPTSLPELCVFDFMACILHLGNLPQLNLKCVLGSLHIGEAYVLS